MRDFSWLVSWWLQDCLWRSRSHSKGGRRGDALAATGALGTAQRFGAISWFSLGFGVFNLVRLWVLPAVPRCGVKTPPWGILA